MNDGLTLPLEIRDHEGNLSAVFLMNAKSHNKSLERGELWTVVPPGDRVLPVEGASFQTLEVVEGHRYRAVLTPGESERVVREAARNRFAGLAAAQRPATDAAEGKESTLEKLRQVISGRHQEMPEGSYTTLLFQKGEEKIRKKTGEEAIELLLAQSRHDLVSESADLIYHLMVLLEVKSIPIGEVLSELEARMR